MFEFFRSYQKFFFIIITAIIVISFSFFGTYATIGEVGVSDKVAFSSLNGDKVYADHLRKIRTFMASDIVDAEQNGVGNFLNDGVVADDFLKTELAKELLLKFKHHLQEDFARKRQREEVYVPYVHANAPFISVENVWEYIHPEMKQALQTLKNEQDPLSEEAIDARIALYLGQRKMAPQMVKRVMLYQESQYEWVEKDPRLQNTDLSLFGYHTLEDWFGPKFMELAAETLINGSAVAQNKGASVSDDEALSQLLFNATRSYDQNRKNPYFSFKTVEDYIKDNLQKLGIDQREAVRLIREILLFKRFLSESSNAVFVDRDGVENFLNYSQQALMGKVYRLPKPLRISSFKDLQRFEIYLEALLGKSSGSLAVPSVLAGKSVPELTKKVYDVRLSHVNVKELEAKVGVKEMWNWQVQDASWKLLKQKFPELGVKSADSQEARVAILEGLSSKTRAQVDMQSRRFMIDREAEVIDKALAAADKKEVRLEVIRKGAKLPLEGAKSGKEIEELLEKPAQNLQKVTFDKENYYQIELLNKPNADQVLTFEEAADLGILDTLLDKRLREYYQSPAIASRFLKDGKDVKPFEEVQDEVAFLYFEKVIDAIRKSRPDLKDLSYHFVAPYRFVNYMKEQKALFEQGKGQTSHSQFALEEGDFKEMLAQALDGGSEERFRLKVGDWSDVVTLPSGDIYFVHIEKKEVVQDFSKLMEKMALAKVAISDELLKIQTDHLIDEMVKKKALTEPFRE